MTPIEISKEIARRLENIHIGCFSGMEKPLLLISEQYPGVWLEHVYDSVFYAKLDRSKLYLAENTIELFISYQTEEGQLPCYVWDKKRVKRPDGELIGYSQLQECVSFAKLALEVYKMNKDKSFLRRIYDASAKWEAWLRKNRMTLGKGLVEMFVGYDTGHDNSGRLSGLSRIGNYEIDGVLQNASVLPSGETEAPIVAVDINCNYFATLTALSKMARELSLKKESLEYELRAKEVKAKLFEICFDKDDCFFYDVNSRGEKRKYLSSTVFHLFMEGVLDVKEDAEIIKGIYERHISNPDEFATPYPYPSMAVNDPSCEGHDTFNCWGYYTQGLIALRSTMWMEKYGFNKEYEYLKKTWVDTWTKHYDRLKMGQELDPITGIPTKSSEWYSSTMLFYLYCVTE